MKVVFYEMNRCLFMVFILLSFALNFFDLKMLIEKKKFQIPVLINNEWVALIIAAWRGLIFWLEITHTYIKFDQQNFTVCLKEVIFRSEFEPAFCEVICFLLHRDGLCSQRPLVSKAAHLFASVPARYLRLRTTKTCPRGWTVTSYSRLLSPQQVVTSTDCYMIPVVTTADNPERWHRKHWDPLLVFFAPGPILCR